MSDGAEIRRVAKQTYIERLAGLKPARNSVMSLAMTRSRLEDAVARLYCKSFAPVRFACPALAPLKRFDFVVFTMVKIERQLTDEEWLSLEPFWRRGVVTPLSPSKEKIKHCLIRCRLQPKTSRYRNPFSENDV